MAEEIKHLMHNAPQEAKLLAYTSLCRPILEYADVVWGPSVKSKVHDEELTQNKAIRFITNLRGRDDNVSVTRKRLKLESLEERRKNQRLCLLTRTLQAEVKNSITALLKDYEEAEQYSDISFIPSRLLDNSPSADWNNRTIGRSVILEVFRRYW